MSVQRTKLRQESGAVRYPVPPPRLSRSDFVLASRFFAVIAAHAHAGEHQHERERHVHECAHIPTRVAADRGTDEAEELAHCLKVYSPVPTSSTTMTAPDRRGVGSPSSGTCR